MLIFSVVGFRCSDECCVLRFLFDCVCCSLIHFVDAYSGSTVGS